MNLDQLTQLLVTKRNEIRELTQTLKEKEQEYAALSEQLLEEMDLHGLSSLKNGVASVSISETTRPGVNDWDAFFSYVLENNASYLIERRPASRACQELAQQGQEIPGIYFFTQRKPNIRVLS